MNDLFPLVTIQILNWNRCFETLRAIQSAKTQTYTNIEIVVVDNGSTDGSVEVIRSTHPDIKVVELPTNLGCPGGRNYGIKYCKGEFIFYLDNDGVLHKQAVENAYQGFLDSSDIGVVTGTIYDFDSESEVDVNIEFKSSERYFYNRFQGGISMHRKSIYNDVGYYPDSFVYGGEEYFLTCKLFQKGIKILKNESVVLWHKRSDLARDRSKELINSFYNRLFIAVNLYPAFYSFVFTVYFIPVYSIYAYRNGILMDFLKSLKRRFISTINVAKKNRSPISVDVFKEIVKPKKEMLYES